MSFLLVLQIFMQVIPDFQVNSEDYASTAIQLFPAITNYDSGSVAIWYDIRMPNNGMRVFGVRLNAYGDTIGTNFIINDDTTTGCLSYPDVDCDFHGNFTTVWVQNSNTNCRRFLNDGTPVGASFVVNNVSASCYGPSIAVDSSGRTVVTWSDNHEYNYRVYGQIYDDTGSPAGTNFPISDSSQTMPMISDVSLNHKKEFITAWGFNGDIWCQRFDSLGNKIGVNFMVSNNFGGDYPAIKCDRNGNFLITWVSGSPSYQSEVFCRLFDSTATPITDVVKLNEPSFTHSWHPKVTNFQNSLWFVVWEDSFSNVYLQRISSEGILLGNNIQINEPVGEWNRYPDIDVSNGNINITWTRRVTSYIYDIVLQVVSSDGSLIGQNKIISDDKGGSGQYWPAIAADTTGNFFIVWDDARTPEQMGLLNQYGKRFDSQGNPLCEDFRINENIDSRYSSISLNKLGLYVTAWVEYLPDSNRQVYGQRFDRNGVLLGSNFQISQAPGNFVVEFPRISSLTDNKFIVVWNDHRIYPTKVHGRILDPLGIPYGDEFTTCIDSTANNFTWSIVDEENGKFILGMCCDKDSIAIAIQEFDYEANPLSAPIILNEIPGGYIPAGAKRLNRYLFVWPDSNWAKIYGQFLDDSLQNIGNNFLVSDDTTNYKTFPCVVSNQSSQFFTLWQQGDYEYEDIYGQFFDSLGNKIGDNFKIDNDTTNSSQWMPSCYSKNNLIYIVWGDARNPAHNYDIYCKVIEWPQTGICEHNLTTFQNLITIIPNPFRNRLNIKFCKGHSVEGIGLKIYDVSGRIIRSFNLASGLVPLASTVSWDGKDDLGNRVAAGVYFIKLNYESDNVIKKVVKIK